MFRPFGSGTTGGSATPPFGAPQTGGFGGNIGGNGTFGSSQLASNTGNPSIFGAPPSTGGIFGSGSGTAPFGAPNPTGFATTSPRYTPTTDTENNVSITLHTITAMSAYQGRSLEEIRLEDYMAGRKGAVPPIGGPGGAGTFGFGTTPSTTVSAPGTTLGGTGTSTFSGSSGNLFAPGTGGGSNPLFNTNAPTGLFSSSTLTAPSGGATSAPGPSFNSPFGIQQSSSQAAFGAGPKPFTSTGATAPFGTGTGSNLFANSTAPGAGMTTSTFGVGGGNTTNLFAAKPASNFGFGTAPPSTTATSTTGQFGTSTTPFGAGSNQFGAGSTGAMAPGTTTMPSSTFSFGQSTAPVSSTSTFGTNMATFNQPTSTFTSLTTPALGGSSLFAPSTSTAPGGISSLPPSSTGGFSFGSTMGPGTTAPISTSAMGTAPFSLSSSGPTTTSGGGFSFGTGSSSIPGGGFSFGTGMNAPSTGLSTAPTMATSAAAAPSFSFGLTQPSTMFSQAPAAGSQLLATAAPQSSSSLLLPSITNTGITAPSSATGGFNFMGSNLTASTVPPSTNTTTMGQLPLISADALSIKPPLPTVLTTPAPSFSTATKGGVIPATSATTTTIARPLEKKVHRTPSKTPPRMAFRLLPSTSSTATTTIAPSSNLVNGTLITAMGYVLPKKTSIKKLVILESSTTGGPTPKNDSRLMSRIPSHESLCSNPSAQSSNFLDLGNSLASLNEGERYMIPNESILRRLSYSQLSAVPNFTVGQKGIGQVRFLVPVDLTKIDLKDIFDRIIIFEPRQITVYPDEEFGGTPNADVDDEDYGEGEGENSLAGEDVAVKEGGGRGLLWDEKPPVGQGLNVPAEIRLERCWCLNKADRQPIKDMSDPRLKAHIERLKKVESTQFVDYLPETGTWIFRVDHF